jgi:hypothetical protein
LATSKLAEEMHSIAEVRSMYTPGVERNESVVPSFILLNGMISQGEAIGK